MKTKDRKRTQKKVEDIKEVKDKDRNQDMEDYITRKDGIYVEEEVTANEEE